MAAAREDIRFSSGDGHCAGWLYPAARRSKLAADAGVPCVVMAHGFACQKEARLDAFAERFAAAGMAVLVFDYRHFGDSSGEPRRLIHTGRQHADWRAAVERARSLDGIDPDRIAIWGSSNSGGHVIWVAARDERIAAVVSQVPHTDGIVTVRNIGPKRVASLTVAGIRDQAGAALGRVHEMKIVGPPGSGAAMTGDDADTLYPGMYPADWDFVNGTPARIMLSYARYSPGREAAKVRSPMLIIVATRDTIAPPEPALKAAERAPNCTLLTYDGGHFDIYRGERFEWAVGEETRFLVEGLQPRTA